MWSDTAVSSMSWQQQADAQITNYLKNRHGDEHIDRGVLIEVYKSHMMITIIGKSNIRKGIREKLQHNNPGVEVETKHEIEKSLEEFESDDFKITRASGSYTESVRTGERVSESSSYTVELNSY